MLSYKSTIFPRKVDQIKALKLLVILLPDVHRNTLKCLLDFLSKVIDNEVRNRMSLQNVAMIIAPNLFIPKKSKKNSERELTEEINMAAITCKITKMLIKYKEILWTVPNFLVQQIRRQNEALQRRQGGRENSKHVKRFLNKPSRKADIYRKINNEVDFQDGIIRVNAPQFCRLNHPIKLDVNTTAADVISKVIRESRKSKKDLFKRHSEFSQNTNISCLSTDPKIHTLHEVGGNLGERRLDPVANMISVYQLNPNAEWEVRCKHWSNQSVVKEVILM